MSLNSFVEAVSGEDMLPISLESFRKTPEFRAAVVEGYQKGESDLRFSRRNYSELERLRRKTMTQILKIDPNRPFNVAAIEASVARDAYIAGVRGLSLQELLNK